MIRFVRTQSLYKVLERHRKALLKGEKRLARQILEAYRSYEAGLQNDLAKVAKLIHAARIAGTDVNPGWLIRQEQVQRLLAGIRQESQRFTEATASAIAARQKQLVNEAGGKAVELIKATGVRASLSRVPVEQLQELVGLLGSGSPVREIFADFGEKTVQGAFNALTRTAGSGPAVIARELRKEVEGLSRRRALLIARTETNRTHRTATLRNYEANSDVVSGWRWASARDRRTCPICLAMDGSEHPLTEQMASHPACRCSMVPIVRGYTPRRKTGEEWLREQDITVQQAVLGPTRFALWSTRQVNLREMVEQRLNIRWGAYSRLKSLAQLQQERLFGFLGSPGAKPDRSPIPLVEIGRFEKKNLRRILRQVELETADADVEIATIFTTDGRILRAVGYSDKVVFERTDLEKMVGGIMTHNHPSRLPMSAQDVDTAIFQKLREMRAVRVPGRVDVFRNKFGKWTPDQLAEYNKIREEVRSWARLEWGKLPQPRVLDDYRPIAARAFTRLKKQLERKFTTKFADQLPRAYAGGKTAMSDAIDSQEPLDDLLGRVLSIEVSQAALDAAYAVDHGSREEVKKFFERWLIENVHGGVDPRISA